MFSTAPSCCLDTGIQLASWLLQAAAAPSTASSRLWVKASRSNPLGHVREDMYIYLAEYAQCMNPEDKHLFKCFEKNNNLKDIKKNMHTHQGIPLLPSSCCWICCRTHSWCGRKWRGYDASHACGQEAQSSPAEGEGIHSVQQIFTCLSVPQGKTVSLCVSTVSDGFQYTFSHK